MYIHPEDKRGARPTVLAKWIWFAVLAVVLGWAFYAGSAHSQPMFAAEGEGVRIVLTDEPCQLKAVVNLPYRATWEEKGKVYEGCYATNPNFGIVAGYFSDSTVAVMPMRAFSRVTGI